MAVEFIRKHAEVLSDATSCVSVLEQMDQCLARDPKAGETTCALAVVTDQQAFGASVGDSVSG